MAAYIYGDIEVTDSAGYEEYRRHVPALIAAHGGRYLVRGGATTVLEGDLTPRRQIILEFPDMDRLLAFYNSAEYEPLKALRRKCSTGNLVAIAGA
jgi:uncharacterized protein (DUF1330 family)